MRIILVFSILYMSMSIISCGFKSHNIKNIGVVGIVQDSITKEVLRNARVTAICWYDAGFDKTDFISKDTVTDESGQFLFQFSEGFKIEVAAVCQNYQPNSIRVEFDREILSRTSLYLYQDSGFDSRNINLRNLIIQNSN